MEAKHSAILHKKSKQNFENIMQKIKFYGVYKGFQSTL